MIYIIRALLLSFVAVGLLVVNVACIWQPPPPPTPVWKTSVDDMYSIGSVSVTPSEAIYVAGTTFSGDNHLAVIKRYSANGQLEWSRTNPVELIGMQLAVKKVVSDSEERAYVLFRDSLGIGILAYDASGALLWTQHIAGILKDINLVLSPSGNVYALGRKRSNPFSFVIAAYSQIGALLWTREENVGYYSNLQLKPDAQGNLYLSGGSGLTSSLRKYTESGVLIWEKADYPSSTLTVDASNNTYVGAYVEGYVDGAADQPIIRKFSTDGQLLWEKRLSSTEDSRWIVEVLIASDDSIYVILQYTPSLVKLDANGNILWQKYIDLGPHAWGQTYYPSLALIETSDNNIYVSMVSQRGIPLFQDPYSMISVYDKEGNLLMRYGRMLSSIIMSVGKSVSGGFYTLENRKASGDKSDIWLTRY